MTMNIDNRATLLVDSHCHLHNISEISTVLDHAALQFKKAADQNSVTDEWYGVLVFTDGAKSVSFSHLKYMIGSRADKTLKIDDWKLLLTKENASLTAVNSEEKTIFICAGQQIVTRENLELLSILAPTRIADGTPLDNGIEQVIQQGGLPVLPWGVGKWLGQRGKIITRTITQNPTRPLFLGDISARPKGWNRVSQFSLATKYNLPILRGTDPLAVKKQQKWGGDYGFMVQGIVDQEKPAASLKSILTSNDPSIKNYGELNSPVRFIADQLAIRFRS